MLLNTLLAKAGGMPNFEIWQDLAPRRFLINHLLADVIKATEVLPADTENGLFAVITTSPHGLPQTLPPGWSQIDRVGEYFATLRTPPGTSTRQVMEELALELVPLFYPSERLENELLEWLENELSESTYPTDDEEDREDEEKTVSEYSGFLTEREQDLNFIYGNGRTPPQYHGYREDCGAHEGPAYGPPEVSDVDIQHFEERSYFYC
ncbi:hypothetical protein [Neolewinella agarilytica]|uniref:Uncharacterized protein n=1 Tax=Neolewinella agarilytica TaxID=478744 RepID=A0A1H9HES0_9BACT|nr:hypothetical protein [Neolewinella agarilytica]SEQ60762.1 hypothetical protein SAMN05444359_112129 [Neolewinella agarilytica]